MLEEGCALAAAVMSEFPCSARVVLICFQEEEEVGVDNSSRDSHDNREDSHSNDSKHGIHILHTLFGHYIDSKL